MIKFYREYSIYSNLLKILFIGSALSGCAVIPDDNYNPPVRNIYSYNSQTRIYRPAQPAQPVRRSYTPYPSYRYERERETVPIGSGVRPVTSGNIAPVAIGSGVRPVFPDSPPPVPIGRGVEPVHSGPNIGEGVRPAVSVSPPPVNPPPPPVSTPSVPIGSGVRG